ncbi:MAG: radical SAM protein [Candidatus Cloacimonetes bacterium HGW-Cloacimonetes-1]|jgi:MoaA/NifB/PqqE/SkfB family radical SAM enzyme|nr:MAG: radical SAM protein [Candidatus Cloacimonetes bacterium HGW-Cloacimonetes-1]
MKLIHRQRFDSHIMLQFEKARQIMQGFPTRLPFFVRSLHHQNQAARLRAKHSKAGLEVPPLLIFSITKRCNLNCSGCYSKILHTSEEPELDLETFKNVLNEALELGISLILLAGGEPLVRREILEAAALYPSIIFPIFTNGLLLDSEYARFFAKYPHLIPVISLEGGEPETDQRRGEGVYQGFHTATQELNSHKVMWGVSITTTASNIDSVMSTAYAEQLIRQGCRLFFYVEYVPVAAGSEDLVLDDLQKASVQTGVDNLMDRLPAMFVAFPGDEDQFDGCLAAGRGFLHINPNGKVEPCPFAPFSDTNLRYNSLRAALGSEFLAQIRQNHHLLKEGKGGCALWANREWVKDLCPQTPEED